MKVLRIIARLNVGGPARHVVWLTAGLKPDYDTLLVTGVVPPGEDDMIYVASRAGLTPTILREMSREVSFNDVVTAWKLYRLMLRERPDIVHTHTAKAGTVGRVAGLLYRWMTPAALIGRPRRCRFVHTYHGHVFHSYYGRYKTQVFLAVERLLARVATDRIIVISNQQHHEINQEFRVGRNDQFAVIPLGIDLSPYADWKARRETLRKELNASPEEVLVGIVGRLTQIKNHKGFLEAAAELKKISKARVRFLVIGDGGLRSQLEAEASNLGLRNEVVFLGSRKDPENFYPALDIVALTSFNEGTPLSLIEGMANERPVIATAVGGVFDLLGEKLSTFDGYDICERGIRVPGKDSQAFARGLAHLIGDEGLRHELGIRGRAFIEQNYSKDRLLQDVANLYSQLVDSDSLRVSGARP